MGIDTINSLKLNLADLSYILFVIGKEFDLIIQKIEYEEVKKELRQVISKLQDSNNEVIKLYHEIKKNEIGIRNEWYNDEIRVKNLENEVENLKKSIVLLLKENRLFLNVNGK